LGPWSACCVELAKLGSWGNHANAVGEQVDAASASGITGIARSCMNSILARSSAGAKGVMALGFARKRYHRGGEGHYEAEIRK